MKIKTVGIIGGKGLMGEYFAQFFENRGFTVLVSDLKTNISNEETAKKSDLLIFSVPIDSTVKIIESLIPSIKKECVVFDLTSIKTPSLKAMLKSKANEVVGGHPMFGPTTPIAGQVFVLSPGRGEEGLNFLRNIFDEAGAIVKVINAEKHDELMTVVQALNHFTDIAFARALSRTGLEIHDFLELQSPAYRLKLIMMGRILAQSANLYGSILTQNPLNSKSIKLFEDASKELSDIVKKHDLEAFEKYFNESAKYLDDFADTAMRESDLIIEQMFQKKADFIVDYDEVADVAILGPKNTFSDFAAEESFGNTKTRKYCRTIKEVFENVSSGKCEIGLVPVENKLAGSVHESYDSFWEFDDLEVYKEMNLKINLVLAGLKEIPLKHLEKVFSHTSALSQCSRFLEKFRNMSKISVSSTAEAVMHLTQKSAAIVPYRAAKKAHLPILKEHITNSEDNYTRFFFIRRKKADEITIPEQGIRTVLAFELFRTKAGALLKVLQYFYEEKVNLLKLESKPVGDEGDTIFFIDTDGGLTRTQINELEKKVAILKVFGITTK